jgi:hypothetical protein
MRNCMKGLVCGALLIMTAGCATSGSVRVGRVGAGAGVYLGRPPATESRTVINHSSTIVVPRAENSNGPALPPPVIQPDSSRPDVAPLPSLPGSGGQR